MDQDSSIKKNNIDQDSSAKNNKTFSYLNMTDAVIIGETFEMSVKQLENVSDNLLNRKS